LLKFLRSLLLENTEHNTFSTRSQPVTQQQAVKGRTAPAHLLDEDLAQPAH
jgi:hypothetical protein